MIRFVKHKKRKAYSHIFSWKNSNSEFQLSEKIDAVEF